MAESIHKKSSFGDRLTAGRQFLELFIRVRIPVPDPFASRSLLGGHLFCNQGRRFDSDVRLRSIVAA